MPRELLGERLAVLRILEHEDEETCPLEMEDKSSCKQSRKSMSTTQNGISGYTKDDCACYYNYAQQDPLYQYKTSSLPAASTMGQTWNKRICSALDVSPEDLANQLTLLDLPCFKAIGANELTTCSWNKKNKLSVAPNVVAVTKRFNRVSFWTVLEILNGRSPKARAEILTHFIKTGKKLHELNNLHSLFAIISALQSASIYRLTKTWACLSKKDKQQFDKLAELFCEKDNWSALRTYLRSISLPCIPYLGIFLTDLVYIDDITASLPTRFAKMEVILKTLEHYQLSEYDIPVLIHVETYLNSVRYIEELQKFLEDDQYKLSVKLEPPSPIGSCAGSKESVKDTVAKGGSTPFSLSPSHRLGSGSLRLQGTTTQNKFVPAHRKCSSLGSIIFGKSHTEGRMDGATQCGSVNLLDDTLLESPTSVAGAACLSLPQSDTPPGPECELEGFVRRKTLIKQGRKPALPSWQRFWLQISGRELIFYHAKTFKGCSRDDFKAEPCKVLQLADWRVLWQTSRPEDVFELAHHTQGTLYKFKTVNEESARQWVSKIKLATYPVRHFPVNLMSFE